MRWIVLLLLFALTAQATDRFAASPSLADVTTAYNAASNGDVIYIPNGSATWASALTVAKSVHFVGTNGGAVLTRGGDLFIINVGDAGVRGLTLDGNNSALHNITVNGAGTSATAPLTNLFIGTNTFRNNGSVTSDSGAISTYGQVRGVICQNIFDRCNVVLKVMGNNDESEHDNPAFTNGLRYGTSDQLFFEDNIIQFSSTKTGGDPGWIESGQGGRLVVRYCRWNFQNATMQELWDIHGFQNWHGPDPQTGTMIAEYYGNDARNCTGYKWINHRGVFGVFFNNTIFGSGGLAVHISQYHGCNEEVPGAPELFESEIARSYLWNCTDDGAQVSFSENLDDCGVAANVNYWSYTASFNGTVGIGAGTSLPGGTPTTGVGFWVANPSTPTTNAAVTQAGIFYRAQGGAYVELFRPYTYPHPLRGVAGGTIPHITSSTNGLGTNFVAFSYQITTDVGDVTAYGVTNLPTGLSLDTANGAISGTINIANVDTTNYVGLFATNGTGVGYTNMSFVIKALLTPTITSGNTVDATNGIPFSYQIVATQFPTKYGASGLPAGLSVNIDTGVISGTPGVDGEFDSTISATNAVGNASTNLHFSIDPPAPIISVGQNFLFFTEIGHTHTADQSLWVTNAGGGTLTGYVATAATRFIVQAPTNFSLAAGAKTNIVIRYTPNVKATNTDEAVFIHNAGANVTNTLTGIAYPMAPALTFVMTNSLWNTPFTMGANLLEQNMFTGSPQNGGRAVYGFTVPSAGTIVFTGLVNAASAAADSMWVELDAEPADSTDMVWSVATTSGFETRAVTWFIEFPSTSAHVFNVSAGDHKIVVRGREPMQLREIVGTFTAAGGGGLAAPTLRAVGQIKGARFTP